MLTTSHRDKAGLVKRGLDFTSQENESLKLEGCSAWVGACSQGANDLSAANLKATSTERFLPQKFSEVMLESEAGLWMRPGSGASKQNIGKQIDDDTLQSTDSDSGYRKSECSDDRLLTGTDCESSSTVSQVCDISSRSGSFQSEIPNLHRSSSKDQKRCWIQKSPFQQNNSSLHEPGSKEASDKSVKSGIRLATMRYAGINNLNDLRDYMRQKSNNPSSRKLDSNDVFLSGKFKSNQNLPSAVTSETVSKISVSGSTRVLGSSVEGRDCDRKQIRSIAEGKQPFWLKADLRVCVFVSSQGK